MSAPMNVLSAEFARSLFFDKEYNSLLQGEDTHTTQLFIKTAHNILVVSDSEVEREERTRKLYLILMECLSLDALKLKAVREDSAANILWQLAQEARAKAKNIKADEIAENYEKLQASYTPTRSSPPTSGGRRVAVSIRIPEGQPSSRHHPKRGINNVPPSPPTMIESSLSLEPFLWYVQSNYRTENLEFYPAIIELYEKDFCTSEREVVLERHETNGKEPSFCNLSAIGALGTQASDAQDADEDLSPREEQDEQSAAQDIKGSSSLSSSRAEGFDLSDLTPPPAFPGSAPISPPAAPPGPIPPPPPYNPPPLPVVVNNGAFSPLPVREERTVNNGARPPLPVREERTVNNMAVPRQQIVALPRTLGAVNGSAKPYTRPSEEGTAPPLIVDERMRQRVNEVSTTPPVPASSVVEDNEEYDRISPVVSLEDSQDLPNTTLGYTLKILSSMLSNGTWKKYFSYVDLNNLSDTLDTILRRRDVGGYASYIVKLTELLQKEITENENIRYVQNYTPKYGENELRKIDLTVEGGYKLHTSTGVPYTLNVSANRQVNVDLVLNTQEESNFYYALSPQDQQKTISEVEKALRLCTLQVTSRQCSDDKVLTQMAMGLKVDGVHKREVKENDENLYNKFLELQNKNKRKIPSRTVKEKGFNYHRDHSIFNIFQKDKKRAKKGTDRGDYFKILHHKDIDATRRSIFHVLQAMANCENTCKTYLKRLKR